VATTDNDGCCRVTRAQPNSLRRDELRLLRAWNAGLSDPQAGRTGAQPLSRRDGAISRARSPAAKDRAGARGFSKSLLAFALSRPKE
jgi:hypothetical protein